MTDKLKEEIRKTQEVLKNGGIKGKAQFALPFCT